MDSDIAFASYGRRTSFLNVVKNLAKSLANSCARFLTSAPIGVDLKFCFAHDDINDMISLAKLKLLKYK